MADFAIVDFPKLISCKFWVIEKSWNFLTVLHDHFEPAENPCINSQKYFKISAIISWPHLPRSSTKARKRPSRKATNNLNLAWWTSCPVSILVYFRLLEIKTVIVLLLYTKTTIIQKAIDWTEKGFTDRSKIRMARRIWLEKGGHILQTAKKP